MLPIRIMMKKTRVAASAGADPGGLRGFHGAAYTFFFYKLKPVKETLITMTKQTLTLVYSNNTSNITRNCYLSVICASKNNYCFYLLLLQQLLKASVAFLKAYMVKGLKGLILPYHHSSWVWLHLRVYMLLHNVIVPKYWNTHAHKTQPVNCSQL